METDVAKVTELAEYLPYNAYVTFMIHSGPRTELRYADASMPMSNIPSNAWDGSRRQARNDEANAYMHVGLLRIVRRLDVAVIDCDPEDRPLLSMMSISFWLMGDKKVHGHVSDFVKSEDALDLEARVAYLERVVNTFITESSKDEAIEALKRLGAPVLPLDPRILDRAMLLQPGVMLEPSISWEDTIALKKPIVLRVHMRGVMKRPVS